MAISLIHYRTADDRCPVDEWLSGIRDARAKVAIERRLNRLLLGHFGDCKFIWRQVQPAA